MSTKDTKKNDLRTVGNIAGFHGVKGEIKVYPLVNNVEDFKSFKSIFIESESKALKIESVRIHKSFALVKLENYNDKSTVEKFSGLVSVTEEEFGDLNEGEYFLEDLKGMSVVYKDNQEIGLINSVSEEGQVRLFVKPSEDLGCKRDLIVPFVDKYIVRVDTEARVIETQNIEDLLELAR